MNTQPLDEKAIFNEARRIADAAMRDEYLGEVCGNDPSAIQRIRALLSSFEENRSFLESPAVDLTPPVDGWHLTEGPGSNIGPFKLLQQIGEGGMGVVYVAEQTEPVRRKVALKVIKPGMASRDVVARFEAERQALALMDHSNIARVYEAGATQSGRPYFVMELVQGVPLTEYCDECQLSTPERLQLFVTVCQAVQHAHQKGVIHRDLKPTNVLVAMENGRPVPKIIDFGIAKALGQRLTNSTIATGFSQMIGTPLYMSPEQAVLSPLGADTRSDIYSLGVLLYELLTGTTPFQKERFDEAGYDEFRRIIREEDPPCPSTRLSTLSNEAASTMAQRRRAEPRPFVQMVRGDLDWVVMKCLEKDRNRRYETSAALAADVEHYLHHEPVVARPPSKYYRARKFIRRNKWPVVAAVAILAGLVAGITGTTIALVSQLRQRTIAERERAEAQFNLATELHAQGRIADAETYFRAALDSTEVSTAGDRQRAAAAQLRLARVVYERGNPVEAERLYRAAIAAYRANFPGGDPAIAHAEVTFALILRAQQRFEEAEQLFREAYEIYRSAVPADHRATGSSATHLSNVLITLRRYEEAEPVARHAIAELKLTKPIDFIALSMARLELGRDLVAMNRFHEAESEILEAVHALIATEHFHIGMVATIALYSAWDQAEPGRGYDAVAEKWMRKLVGTFIRLEEFWPEDLKAPEGEEQKDTKMLPLD